MMKTKHVLMAAMACLAVCLVSCSDSDDPGKGGSSSRTVTTTMLNHVVNTKTGEVLAPAMTQNKLTIDTAAHTAQLTLSFSDGTTTQTVTPADVLSATYRRLGFYKLGLNGTSSSVSDLSGYVDFNEGNMRYAYTTTTGYRVISTLKEVFYLSTTTQMAYNDTTQDNKVDNAMYQFEINPTTMTATVKVMALVHNKESKYFESITAYNVPVTATKEGYHVEGKNLSTTAIYRAYDGSTGSSTKTTNAYPFGTFTAELSLESETFTASYTLNHIMNNGDTGETYVHCTASAEAKGQVYSSY